MRPGWIIFTAQIPINGSGIVLSIICRPASNLAKPIIIHTRDAREETIDLLRQYPLSAGGVMHCFTETWEMAEAAMELGFYISFSGIVTFNSAEIYVMLFAACLWTDCWWRPTLPGWRQCLIGAARMNPNMCSKWQRLWLI